MSTKKYYNNVEVKADLAITGNATLPGTNSIATQPSGNLTATDLNAALAELQGDIDSGAAALTSHLNDASDAHDASAISNVPAGTIAATDVQAAINELDGDIQAHLSDATDAHDASAVSVVPTGNLAADDVQEALVELQGDIDDIYADIAALPDPMEYKGTWSAATNTPTLTDGSGDNGDVYHVNAAGTVDFGNGNISFEVGDKVVYNGATARYEKWDMTDAVSSVFGRTGAVTAQNGDYTASQVTNVPAGSIAAVTVQAAINELDGDIQGHITDASDAHDASAISVVPSGNLASTDVQAALEELQTDIDNLSPGSPGDIDETSFSLANNQASPADVTGLAFANGVVRSFEVLASVEIDATAAKYEVYKMLGVQKGASWDMSVESTGDDAGVLFTITNSGQVQYTSSNNAGFVSAVIKFRAIVTSF